MATKSGILSIVGNESRLDDGTLLARCSESSPLSAATAFLTGLGLQSGDRIRVTGSDGTIGNVVVFCMTAAQRDAAFAVAAAAVPTRKRAPKRGARKSAMPSKKRSVAKKPSAKKATKKSSKKKARGHSWIGFCAAFQSMFGLSLAFWRACPKKKRRQQRI